VTGVVVGIAEAEEVQLAETPAGIHLLLLSTGLWRAALEAARFPFMVANRNFMLT
jgi:hypothetical protein